MKRHLAAGLTAAALLAGCPPAFAGSTMFTTFAGVVTVPVTSLREARFHTVIRQEHDFSCGSAALATLLTYHYGHPVSEDTVFNSMFEVGDRHTIEKFGFSLADMQRYLAAIGIRSDGYRVSLDKVAQVGVPVITLISTHGYNHFVVIKGIKDGDVLVGDPAAGLRAIPRPKFEAMWQGIAFVIRDDIADGRKSFNRPDEWGVRRDAPAGTALDRQGLATFSTMLPQLFQFSESTTGTGF